MKGSTQGERKIYFAKTFGRDETIAQKGIYDNLCLFLDLDRWPFVWGHASWVARSLCTAPRWSSTIWPENCWQSPNLGSYVLDIAWQSLDCILKPSFLTQKPKPQSQSLLLYLLSKEFQRAVSAWPCASVVWFRGVTSRCVGWLFPCCASGRGEFT